MEKYCRLIISYTCGDCYEYIHGTRECMQEAYEQIKQALESLEGAVKIITVEGWVDSADRRLVEFTFLVEHIKSVGLMGL